MARIITVGVGRSRIPESVILNSSGNWLDLIWFSILIPKEAERRTFEAAKGMIDKSIYDALTASNNNEAEMPRYMQV